MYISVYAADCHPQPAVMATLPEHAGQHILGAVAATHVFQAMRWSGRIAGANKGLGCELCRILLEDKHPVIAACRTQEKGMQLVLDSQRRSLAGQ